MSLYLFQIPVKADLEVGQNLQDHLYVPLGPLVHNDSTASLVNPTDLEVGIYHGIM